MKKSLKITLSVVSVLLISILITFMVYFFWPWNKDFFKDAKQEFIIPGLDTKFTPQGMVKLNSDNKYLISGYMSDGSPSRFYLVDSKENKVDKYFTLKMNSKNYSEHAGGISIYGSTVWVVSSNETGGNAYRFHLSDIEKVENGKFVEIIDHFNTNNGADFSFVDDGYLYIGEFYKKGKYETSEKHIIKISNDEVNRAMVYGYLISENDRYGLKYDYNNPKPLPDRAISIRGLCQGIAKDSNGNFILSTSYGLSDSNLYYYKNVLKDKPFNEKFRVGLKEIPLYVLSNSSLISSKKIPAMSEGIVVNDNLLYILFESGAKKYKMFNRKRLSNVYSISLDILKKDK